MSSAPAEFASRTTSAKERQHHASMRARQGRKGCREGLNERLEVLEDINCGAAAECSTQILLQT